MHSKASLGIYFIYVTIQKFILTFFIFFNVILRKL